MEGKYVMRERERLEAELAEVERLHSDVRGLMLQYKAERDALIREPIRDMFDEASDRADKAEKVGRVLEDEVAHLRKELTDAISQAGEARRERDEAIALAETLRGALNKAGELVLRAYPIVGERVETANAASWIGEAIDEVKAALSLAPPQALAQQRERMEKALRVVIDECVDGMRHEDEDCPQDDTCTCENAAKVEAACKELLAEFDAERGRE